jgi:hypothetical protein
MESLGAAAEPSGKFLNPSVSGNERLKTKSLAQSSLLEYRTASGARAIGSISALAEHVHSRAGAGYREARTMVPFLSEVLRGKKQAPPQVIEQILLFVRQNLSAIDSSEAKAIEEHFRNGLEDVPVGLQEQAFACAKPDISSLLRTVRTAREIVAVLPGGVFGEDVGRKVLHVFATRVGLLDSQAEREAEGLRVTLWFKDELRARKWWFLLQDFLDEVAPDRSAADHVRSLMNACEEGIIQALVVDPMATGAKVIVADASNPTEASGFTFNLSRGLDVLFLSSMGPEGTKEWIEDVLGRIDKGEGPKRVTARSVLG